MVGKKTKHKRIRHNNEKLPIIKFSLMSNDESYKNNFANSLDAEEIAKAFWRDIPHTVRTRVLEHYKRVRKFTPKQSQMFMDSTAELVSEILQDVIARKCPKYSAFNYSIEVYSRRLLNFDIFLYSLEVKHTQYGNVYLLPDLRYPTNKKLGVSTHAIQRMDSRVLLSSCHLRSLTLRLPLVLIPYKKNIFGLYFGILDKTRRINKVITPLYLLIGYFPIVETENLFVGKTILSPGFDGTPECGIPDDQLGNYRLLAAIDGSIYRVLPPEARRSSIRGVPYELKHPNIKMLCNMNKLVSNNPSRIGD